MNELMNTLADALKEEEVYRAYVQAKNDLQKHEALLIKFKEAKENYIKMKPYFPYQDFSELKKEVTDLAHQVSLLPEYQNYHHCEQALQCRLNELTAIIFKNVLIEAEVGGCVSLPENINEEI